MRPAGMVQRSSSVAAPRDQVARGGTLNNLPGGHLASKVLPDSIDDPASVPVHEHTPRSATHHRLEHGLRRCVADRVSAELVSNPREALRVENGRESGFPVVVYRRQIDVAGEDPPKAVDGPTRVPR